jgi:hypothetical protein
MHLEDEQRPFRVAPSCGLRGFHCRGEALTEQEAGGGDTRTEACAFSLASASLDVGNAPFSASFPLGDARGIVNAIPIVAVAQRPTLENPTRTPARELAAWLENVGDGCVRRRLGKRRLCRLLLCWQQRCLGLIVIVVVLDKRRLACLAGRARLFDES